MAFVSTAGRNRLLDALPGAERERWASELTCVRLTRGQVLSEAHSSASYVYFPTTAIVSLIYEVENGSTAEVALVGNDGLVGVSILLGGESTSTRAVVQSAGDAFRVSARAMTDQLHRPPFQRVMLLYIQALLTQTAQTAVCNRYHPLDQQLCRWLLLNLDRLDGNELLMTQEMIADRLGVRREAVTGAALKLQSAGLIEYARGRISVIDRIGIEARSCECYRILRKESARLLSR